MKVKALSLIPRSLDGIIAVLGIVFSLGLIGYLSIQGGRAVYIVIGILTLFFSLLWLKMRNKVSLVSDQKKHHTSILLINIVFYSLLVILILSYYLRPHLYERPLIYFFLFSLMAACISLEIYLYTHHRRHLKGIMCKILFLSLISVWSEAALFPSILGVDPWAHQKLTQVIVQTGYIPGGYSYSKLPLMHLDIGATMMLTGLNYKLASMVSIGFFQIICGILSGFLIGRFLFNEKVGLLAALIIPLGNQFISMGFAIIPNTIAAVFIPLILYLILIDDKRNHTKIVLLTILLMVALIFTHTISSMCLAMILLVGWSLLKLSRIIFQKKWKMLVTMSMLIFFFVAMFSWWSYISGHMMTLYQFFRLGFSQDIFIQAPLEVVTYLSSVPFVELLFNQFGMFLLFSFSFFGIFYMVSRKIINPYMLMVVIAGFTPLLIAFFSVVSGVELLPQRWWYFAQFLLAVPVAVTFLLLSSTVTRKRMKPFFLVCGVFLICFFMIASPTANIDNPTFSPNTNIRFALTDSEISAAAFCVEHDSVRLSSDFDFFTGESSSILLNYFSYNSSNIISLDEFLLTGQFDLENTVIVIRNEIVHNTFRVHGQPFQLRYNPHGALVSQGFSQIYNSTLVSCYLRDHIEHHV